MAKKRLPFAEVLRYTNTKRRDSAKIRRYFLRWCEEQNPPVKVQCATVGCQLHSGDLLWNGKRIKLILDHINGNNTDNRPKNLRFLCPNCDSQLSTRGGGNRGRVEKSDGGFALGPKKGPRVYVLPAETGAYTLSFGTHTARVNRKKPPG